jgi:ectoine hydroxylase-related dioxygenase (phytanoyl-CoA dioxygenase family)
MGGRVGDTADPLNKFPRLIDMHEWDERTSRWAADERMCAVVAQLIDDEPVLNQTMLYFKPPGARGQGLHQDQQYITIDPLIGAWVALDVADEANGRMVVVPGSNRGPLLPVQAADKSLSFTPGETVLPQGAQPLGIDMLPGDCLFFSGKTIHGSYPNITKDRFRRSFICHYVGKHAKHFKPAKGTNMSHV